MQYQKWMDIVELVGVAAIVASLIFVGLQLRQDSDIARTEADLSYLGILVEVRQLLNDDADIWVKANSGIELSNAEAFVFSNLVRTENDRRFYQHEAAARLYGKDEAATIMHDFAAFLYQHAAARAECAVQENNYLKFRRILHAGYDYSFWMNGINSDLAALDEGDATSAQPVDIPRDQYVEINGARLHYLDWGGNGPTMLMVHGLWQTAHWYDGIAPHFTDRYRVIGITRREHGASQKGTGQLSLDVLVDDLSDFLRIFTSEPAVVVGHSYAGIEIPKLAHEHPDQIEAIILLDAIYDWPMWNSADVPTFPSPWDFPDNFASFDAMDHWYQTTYVQVWSKALIEGLRSQAYLASDGSVKWQFPFQSSKGSEFFALSEPWPEDAFAGIEVPILSIQADFGGFFEREFERQQVSEKDRQDALTWAEYDTTVKRRGREQLQRAAPHAEHRMFADTHHWLFIQRPTRVIVEMNAFLRDN